MAKPGRPKRQEPHKVARYNGRPRHQATSPRRPASRERWSRLLLFRETFETVRSSSLDHSILSYLIVALRSLAHCASPLISKQTTWVVDLPIYAGNLAEVQSYEQTWQGLIDRAKGFYPSAGLPPDYLPLPASLEIPQFIYHVQKLHLTRTKAKESKNFGSVGALVE